MHFWLIVFEGPLSDYKSVIHINLQLYVQTCAPMSLI